MPEIRKDPIVNRWVIVATERARRPGGFVDPVSHETPQKDCPFCHGTEQPVYTAPSKDGHLPWSVKVVTSGTPFFKPGEVFQRNTRGLYDSGHSYGAHEVVIETPDHVANMADLPVSQIQQVFETYAMRMRHYAADPQIRYVLAYKNHGLAAGSRPIGHARSQIMAVPVNPIRVKDKLAGAKRYFDFHERCVFCDLIKQEMADGKRVLMENKSFVVLMPFASRFPFELMILPKTHNCHYVNGVVGHEADLAEIMKKVLMTIKLGLNDPSYNFVIHSAPTKPYPNIIEDYHWHIELMPRLTRVAGFERGTGFYINPIPPEMTTQFLKEVKI